MAAKGLVMCNYHGFRMFEGSPLALLLNLVAAGLLWAPLKLGRRLRDWWDFQMGA